MSWSRWYTLAANIVGPVQLKKEVLGAGSCDDCVILTGESTGFFVRRPTRRAVLFQSVRRYFCSMSLIRIICVLLNETERSGRDGAREVAARQIHHLLCARS
jgi:hypothetical protein